MGQRLRRRPNRVKRRCRVAPLDPIARLLVSRDVKGDGQLMSERRASE